MKSLLPAKVEKSITPKPTKSEVVEALALHILKRDMEDYNTRLASQQEKRKGINERINKLPFGDAEPAFSYETSYSNGKRETVLLKVTYRIPIPDQLMKEKIAIDDAINSMEFGCERWWNAWNPLTDKKTLREAKRRALLVIDNKGHEPRAKRIQGLLDDPAVSKSFDRAIKEQAKRDHRASALAA